MGNKQNKNSKQTIILDDIPLDINQQQGQEQQYKNNDNNNNMNMNYEYNRNNTFQHQYFNNNNINNINNTAVTNNYNSYNNNNNNNISIINNSPSLRDLQYIEKSSNRELKNNQYNQISQLNQNNISVTTFNDLKPGINNSSILNLKNKGNNDSTIINRIELSNIQDDLKYFNNAAVNHYNAMQRKKHSLLPQKMKRISAYSNFKYYNLNNNKNNKENNLYDNIGSENVLIKEKKKFIENSTLLPDKYLPEEFKQIQDPDKTVVSAIERFSVINSTENSIKKPKPIITYIDRLLLNKKEKSLLEHNPQLVNLVSEYTELSQGLCVDHFISVDSTPKNAEFNNNINFNNNFQNLNFNNFMNNNIDDELLDSSNKFFTKTLIYILNTYSEAINDYLKLMIPEPFNPNELVFFKSNYNEYNELMEEKEDIIDFRFNFIGFSEKRFFYKAKKIFKIKNSSNNDNINSQHTKESLDIFNKKDNNDSNSKDFLSRFNLEEKTINNSPTHSHTNNINNKYTTSNNRNSTVSSALDNIPELFIININKRYLKAGYLFAIKIFQNGKLLAGCIDDNLNFQGCGIYISKSGNVISGIFENNIISFGKCLSFKSSSLYEGTFKNHRKHGTNCYEDSEFYEFYGDFENGKKMKGVYNIKNHFNVELNNNINNYYSQFNNNLNNNIGNIGNYNNVNNSNLNYLNASNIRRGSNNTNVVYKNININNKSHYILKSIEIDRKILENKVKIIIVTPENTSFSYFGYISNGKLFDESSEVIFDLEKGYPKYEGSIINNVKEGKAKYIWSDNVYLKSKFSNNLPHSFLNNANATSNDIQSYGNSTDRNLFENKNIEKGVLVNNENYFDCIFKNGQLISFKVKESEI